MQDSKSIGYYYLSYIEILFFAIPLAADFPPRNFFFPIFQKLLIPGIYRIITTSFLDF